MTGNRMGGHAARVPRLGLEPAAAAVRTKPLNMGRLFLLC